MARWSDGLRRGDHIVHIYNSDEARRRVFLDVLAWTRDDEKLVAYYGQGGVDESLQSRGVVQAAIDSGRLELIPTSSVGSPKGLSQKFIDKYHEAMDEGNRSLVVLMDATEFLATEELKRGMLEVVSGPIFRTHSSNFTKVGVYDGRTMSREEVAEMERVHQLVLSEGRITRNFWAVRSSSIWELNERLPSAPRAAEGVRSR